jgi:hypothetical protein
MNEPTRGEACVRFAANDDLADHFRFSSVIGLAAAI